MAQNQGEARFSTEADKFMKTVTRVLPPWKLPNEMLYED